MAARERDDPRFLLTHFGRLLFCGPDRAIAQGEMAEAPRDLVIARDEAGLWRLFRLPTALAARGAIVDLLRHQGNIEPVADVTVEPMPGPDRFALRQGGHHLSAGPQGGVAFRARHRLSWEIFDGLRPGTLARRAWRPERTMGGTQLMLHGLQERLGGELDRIDLQLHEPAPVDGDARKRVVWIHNGPGSYFAWCNDPARVAAVDAFVFVSAWQRHRFIDKYELPPDKCHVIRNATAVGGPPSQWASPAPWRLRCAYVSAPNRGLSVLLDAWEQFDEPRAELHIWSSYRLWGPHYKDAGDHALLARASRMPGVVYHGIGANADVRAALRDMHLLAYPSTMPETSCLAAIEAMAAGCRLIVPALGALPETSAGFARLYPFVPDPAAHAARFAALLAEEFRLPWGGDPGRAWAQVAYTRAWHDWEVCVAAWRVFIAGLCPAPRQEVAPPGPGRV